jgi:hypothetical protein
LTLCMMRTDMPLEILEIVFRFLEEGERKWPARKVRDFIPNFMPWSQQVAKSCSCFAGKFELLVVRLREYND